MQMTSYYWQKEIPGKLIDTNAKDWMYLLIAWCNAVKLEISAEKTRHILMKGNLQRNSDERSVVGNREKRPVVRNGRTGLVEGSKLYFGKIIWNRKAESNIDRRFRWNSRGNFLYPTVLLGFPKLDCQRKRVWNILEILYDLNTKIFTFGLLKKNKIFPTGLEDRTFSYSSCKLVVAKIILRWDTFYFYFQH